MSAASLVTPKVGTSFVGYCFDAAGWRQRECMGECSDDKQIEAALRHRFPCFLSEGDLDLRNVEDFDLPQSAGLWWLHRQHQRCRSEMLFALERHRTGSGEQKNASDEAERRLRLVYGEQHATATVNRRCHSQARRNRHRQTTKHALVDRVDGTRIRCGQCDCKPWRAAAKYPSATSQGKPSPTKVQNEDAQPGPEPGDGAAPQSPQGCARRIHLIRSGEV